jgi:hypothetical protein
MKDEVYHMSVPHGREWTSEPMTVYPEGISLNYGGKGNCVVHTACGYEVEEKIIVCIQSVAKHIIN